MRNRCKALASILATTCVVALGAAGSASATQWNPQGGPTGPFSSTITYSDTGGGTFVCVLSGYMNTSGAVATTADASGAAAGPVWSSCSNNISPMLTACITSSSAWTLTAINTSSVIESGINFVLKLGTGSTCASPICTETVTGGGVDGTYNNTTHELAEDPSSAFAVTGSGFCPGSFFGSFNGTIRMPTTVTIT